MSIHNSLKKIKRNTERIKLDFDIEDNKNIIICKMLFDYMETRENGKRSWIQLSDGSIDYGSSTETNYPDWMKFYFDKTPKNLRNSYEDWGELGLKGKKPWEAGFFNGNRRELLYTLKNASEGKAPRSDRMITVLNEAFNSFLSEIEESQLSIEESQLSIEPSIASIDAINEAFNLAKEEDDFNLEKINEDHMIEFN